MPLSGLISVRVKNSLICPINLENLIWCPYITLRQWLLMTIDNESQFLIWFIFRGQDGLPGSQITNHALLSRKYNYCVPFSPQRSPMTKKYSDECYQHDYWMSQQIHRNQIGFSRFGCKIGCRKNELLALEDHITPLNWPKHALAYQFLSAIVSNSHWGCLNTVNRH